MQDLYVMARNMNFILSSKGSYWNLWTHVVWRISCKGQRVEIGRMVSTWIAQAGKESGLGERTAGYTKCYSPLSLFASSHWNSILHYLLLHNEHQTPDIQYLYSKHHTLSYLETSIPTSHIWEINPC